MDQHAVSPVQKSGLRARTIYWERHVRISSWPGCNRSPLARGRIHLCNWNRHLRCRVPLHGRGGPYILSQKVFQSRIVQHRICQEPFQLRVLVFQRLQALGFGYVHAAELGFPLIDAGIADAVLAAKLRDRRASLVLLQNADDLFFCKTIALHSLVLSMGQSLLQNGLFQRGKVTTNEGRYAWARVGFQADNEFWFSAKEALLNTLKIDARFRNSTDLDLAIRIIDSNDPLALHYLTGLKNLVPVEAGGQNEMTSFGRALLTSVGSWRGEFDLTNKSYMQLLAGRR